MDKGGPGPPPPKSSFGMYNGAPYPGPPQRSAYGQVRVVGVDFLLSKNIA